MRCWICGEEARPVCYQAMATVAIAVAALAAIVFGLLRP